VEAVVAVHLVEGGGLARAREVAAAALSQEAGPLALSLAADVAMIEGRPTDAERHLVRALELSDHVDLHLRLAGAIASRGRPAEALEVLEPLLAADPALEAHHPAAEELLEGLAERVAERPELCPCGSGLGYGDCCEHADRRALARFTDRTALLELQEAVATFCRSRPELEEAFAAGIWSWVEAGAVSEDELGAWAATPDARDAATLRMMGELAWLLPLLDGERTALIEAFAAEPGRPADVARRARDHMAWAFWGLWEVARPAGSPGVLLTELLTGMRLYAEVPAVQLEGLARWSVLVGYVVPVDGRWHAGSAFVAATPLEGRMLADQLVEAMIEVLPGVGPEGRRLLRWARQVHDVLLDELWMAGQEPPRMEDLGLYQAVVRRFTPGLVGSLREIRATEPDAEPDAEPAEIVVVGLRLEAPDAAWQALAGHPDFHAGEDEDELGWLPAGGDEPGEAMPVAWLARQPDGIAVQLEDRELVPELLATLEGLDHPAAVAFEEVLELPDEPEPEEPVTVPELDAGAMVEWLRAWPDEALPVLDGETPRGASAGDQAGRWRAEVLVRHLEHQLDRGGATGADTTPVREALGLTAE